MKRFSVLVIVVFILGSIIANFNRFDWNLERIGKEVTEELIGEENKDRGATTEKDCSANTDAKFVSDTNVSDKR